MWKHYNSTRCSTSKRIHLCLCYSLLGSRHEGAGPSSWGNELSVQAGQFSGMFFRSQLASLFLWVNRYSYSLSKSFSSSGCSCNPKKIGSWCSFAVVSSSVESPHEPVGWAYLAYQTAVCYQVFVVASVSNAVNCISRILNSSYSFHMPCHACWILNVCYRLSHMMSQLPSSFYTCGVLSSVTLFLNLAVRHAWALCPCRSARAACTLHPRCQHELGSVWTAIFFLSFFESCPDRFV